MGTPFTLLELYYFRAIQSYGDKYSPTHGGFEMVAFFQAVGEFLLIFTLSLILGSTLGIATALVFTNCLAIYKISTRILMTRNNLVPFLNINKKVDEIHSNPGFSSVGNVLVCVNVLHNFPHS